MRDLENNSIVISLLPAKRLGGTDSSLTTTGTAVDTKGEARKMFVILSIGAIATNTLSITIQESADNSSWATLDATTFANLTATDDEKVVDLTPTKRYVRAVATLSQTNTYYVDVALIGVFYNERYTPANVA